MDKVPYEIVTPRLRMRCWKPRDAAQRRALIDSSDAHLRPFIPWMRDEPLSLSETAQRLREYRSEFDTDQTWRYAVFHEDMLIGDVGLFPRVGPDALEIGFLLGVAYTGRGFATEAASALVRAGFEIHGVDRIELRCDPVNQGSIRLAERLKFRQEAKLPRRYLNEKGQHVDIMVWSLYKSGYAGSPIAAAPMHASDAMGVTLLGSRESVER